MTAASPSERLAGRLSAVAASAASRAAVAARMGVPFVVALAIGALVLVATGKNPVQVYGLLAREAFGSPVAWMNTLTAATPLLFTGLGIALAFRAGVFTLGVEGSFVAGGLAAAVVGAQVAALPAPFAVGAALLAATGAGLAVAVVPAALRVWWSVDEVVTTLMFNFVVLGVTGWLVTEYLQVKGVANSATAFVAESAQLPRLAPPSQLNAGLLIALALVVAYAVWIRRGVLGYEFRQTGTNPRFALAHGIKVGRVVLIAMLVAGAIGGLGGGSHTLGVVHRFVAGFSPGYGWTGLAIALLARFSAPGVAIGAVLFGALASAGATIQLFADVPLQLVNVLQGTVMIFAVAQFVLPRLRRGEKP